MSVLPSIALVETRVRLLAWTYNDAATGVDDGGRGGKPQSRAPGRCAELWNHGSYEELEHAIDRVSRADRRAFQSLFVDRRLSDQPVTHIALLHVTQLMRRRVVYVPSDVAEAAGYLLQEAKRYHRKHRTPDDETGLLRTSVRPDTFSSVCRGVSAARRVVA